MNKFEVGKKYKMEFGVTGPREDVAYCTFKVVKRTEKTVTLKGSFINQQTIKTCRIKIEDGGETCKPYGTDFHMPTLTA